MQSPRSIGRRALCALALSQFLLLSPGICADHDASNSSAPQTHNSTIGQDESRLRRGEVVVSCEDIANTKYVVGKIIIDESPQKLWTTLVNPFEFEGKICHRMKEVKIITDQPDMSLLGCTVGVVFPIPDLKYVVESHYTACSKVEFKRISGSLRDFKGFWGLQPIDDGSKTEVTYSMYIDPGFPVPDWIIRQGVKGELPSVLIGLRERVKAIKKDSGAAAKRNLAAANWLSAVPGAAGIHIAHQP